MPRMLFGTLYADRSFGYIGTTSLVLASISIFMVRDKGLLFSAIS
jgi:hypothetical protein